VLLTAPSIVIETIKMKAIRCRSASSRNKQTTGSDCETGRDPDAFHSADVGVLGVFGVLGEGRGAFAFVDSSGPARIRSQIFIPRTMRQNTKVTIEAPPLNHLEESPKLKMDSTMMGMDTTRAEIVRYSETLASFLDSFLAVSNDIVNI